jgi:hypothetical protein
MQCVFGVADAIVKTDVTTIDGSCESFDIICIGKSIQIVLFPEPAG